MISQMPNDISRDMLADEALIELVKKGDDKAFQQLMERYLKHIFNFVRQYIRASDDAEDVTQDTFFKTWKYIKRFKKGMKFKPWLFTIARNTALDHIKKKRAISFSDMNNSDDKSPLFEDTVADNEPLPPELFAQAELADEFKEVLSMLHPDHQAVLTMHYQQEMTFEEIAEIMDKPMNTVKSWHRRSLSKVKEKLMHRKPL